MNVNEFMQAMQNLWVYRGPNQEEAIKEYVKTLSGYNTNWESVFNQLKVKHKTTSWPTIGTIADFALKELIIVKKPIDESKSIIRMTEDQIFDHIIGQGCLEKGLGLALSDFVGKHNRFPNKEECALLKSFMFDRSEFRGKFLQIMIDRQNWSKNKEEELKAKYYQKNKPERMLI